MNLTQGVLIVSLVLLSALTKLVDCRAPFHLFEDDQSSLPAIRRLTRASPPHSEEVANDDEVDTSNVNVANTRPTRMSQTSRSIVPRMFKTKKNGVLKFWKYFAEIRKSKNQVYSHITRLPY